MNGPDESESRVQPALTPSGAALLALLESSRDRIARGLVREAPAITDPELNYLTISTLLEALYLKTCQECGLIERGTLAALAGCDGIAHRMGRLCSGTGLDPGLFFEPGPAGPRLLPGIPDEPLRAAIGRLDTPEIPAPVAGLSPGEVAAVLEHFVANRLQVGEGYRVVKAGKSALLYTGRVDVPSRDIIGHVAGRAAREVSGSPASGGPRKIRILDPACGAGLFLLALFRTFVRSSGREERDRIPERMQEILGDSLFGTDIDPESVSAARLVLLLAFMDEWRGAGAGTPPPDQIAGAAHALTGTIRCGNALIAPDYFTGKPVFPFNAEERRRVNAFDYKASFPAVMAGGGFDAVIGAPPPYRPFSVKAREEYFQTHYDSYAVSAGLYGYFIERGLSLLRPGGTLAFLVPGTFTRSEPARPLRRLLLSRQIDRIAGTGMTRSLPEGETAVHLLVLKNQPPAQPFTVVPDLFAQKNDFLLDQRSLDDGGWRLEDTRAAAILEKVRAKGTLLEEYVMGEIGAGTHNARDNPLVVDRTTRNRLTEHAWWARRYLLPLLCPADLRRYTPEKPSRFVITGTGDRKIRKCRALAEYLESNQENMQEKVQEHFLPEKPLHKIIFSPFGHSPAFCYDYRGAYALPDTLSAILKNDPYLVAILNSTLGRFVITHICPYSDRGYHASPAAIGKFPVVVPDFEKFSDKKLHERIVALVVQMISLQEYLPQAKTDQERRLVQQEIDATDVRIDALVYELYGLTPEEIAVAETRAGSIKSSS